MCRHQVNSPRISEGRSGITSSSYGCRVQVHLHTSRSSAITLHVTEKDGAPVRRPNVITTTLDVGENGGARRRAARM